MVQSETTRRQIVKVVCLTCGQMIDVTDRDLWAEECPPLPTGRDILDRTTTARRWDQHAAIMRHMVDPIVEELSGACEAPLTGDHFGWSDLFGDDVQQAEGD